MNIFGTGPRLAERSNGSIGDDYVHFRRGNRQESVPLGATELFWRWKRQGERKLRKNYRQDNLLIGIESTCLTPKFVGVKIAFKVQMQIIASNFAVVVVKIKGGW